MCLSGARAVVITPSIVPSSVRHLTARDQIFQTGNIVSHRLTLPSTIITAAKTVITVVKKMGQRSVLPAAWQGMGRRQHHREQTAIHSCFAHP
jgi:hypothetical protein